MRVTFLETLPVPGSLAEAVSILAVSRLYLRHRNGCYVLAAADLAGHEWTLVRTDSEDEALEAWCRLVRTLRACGAGWVPPLSD